MPFPAYFDAFPLLDLPLDDAVVTARAIRSDSGLAVFFTFHQDIDLPEHSHKGQWGTVIAGTVTITMAGRTRTYRPGEDYEIPSGMPHAVRLTKGTQAIDVFEEPDRYPLRG
ncbi:MAG: cupin domain-containing protein [Limimaricola sp.]|uniref:cupin domain-containing protein n=1 Tax=Limimaricola sp. TaxID=2211665 RepID=UPI001D883820|nr:cupin domain-containing protein [Limimaricola sp.]MBI1417578.1 cupin domain-containing protein [Limimaricola sp.]